MSLVYKVISAVEDPTFASYVACGSVLVLKTMLMVPLIDRERIKYGVLVSPEDANLRVFKGKTITKSHENVNRLRRAHLSDLENIPIFFFAGFAYVLTDPNPSTAINLFRTYTLARCVHTFAHAVYIVPKRAILIASLTGYIITGYMTVKAFLHFNTFNATRAIATFATSQIIFLYTAFKIFYNVILYLF